MGEARYHPCGDWLRIEVRVEGARIQAVGFDATGCGVAVAAGSACSELLLKIEDVVAARNITAFDLDRALGGVPPQKRHAILMALECVAGALGSRVEYDKEEGS